MSIFPVSPYIGAITAWKKVRVCHFQVKVLGFTVPVLERGAYDCKFSGKYSSLILRRLSERVEWAVTLSGCIYANLQAPMRMEQASVITTYLYGGLTATMLDNQIIEINCSNDRVAPLSLLPL